MNYEKILYSVSDGVARVSLNDPATLNAASEQMGNELLDAFDRARGEARAILLTGEGRAFCSGANLAGAADAMSDPRRDVGRGLDRAFNPAIVAMKTLDIPIVTAVRGAAAGVGAALAMAGDIIVCGDQSYFFLAFRHVGLIPDGGSSWLLSKAVGRVRAMELMLLGGKLSGQQAVDWGLATRVVPEEEVEGSASTIARELASGPLSLGMIKRQAWAALDDSLEGALTQERLLQREVCRSEDFAEGVAAFREKRKPSFKGR